METVSFEVLKTMGRWFAVLVATLLSQPAFSAEQLMITQDLSIWHNALFLFCICFFLAGFIFMMVMRFREDHKQRIRHGRRLSHRHSRH
jgi:ascorbate-specific PTS system EIIC-type component UlaA